MICVAVLPWLVEDLLNWEGVCKMAWETIKNGMGDIQAVVGSIKTAQLLIRCLSKKKVVAT